MPDESFSAGGGAGGEEESLLGVVTTDGGTEIDVSALVTVMSGIVTAAFGTSLADAISETISAWFIAPLEELAAFFEEIQRVYAVPGYVLTNAWIQAETFITSFGPISFIVAVLFVVLVAYLVATGWSLRG